MTPTAKAAPVLGLVVAALVIVYVVWGSTYLAIRIVVEEAPPFTSMGLRYLTAGIIVGALVALRGGLSRLRIGPREALGAAFLGLMLPVLGNGVVSLAESKGATSGVAALLLAVTPLFIVMFRAVDGDRPRPLTLLGVLLGLVGLAVLLLGGRGGAEDFGLLPALLVVLAATCWGLGSYLQPRLWLPKDVFVTAVYEMVFGGIFLLVVGAAFGERFTGDYDARTWTALAYLVVFGSVIAFTAYIWLLDNAPISFVATYAYVNPVVAVLLGWWILNEVITVPILVGGGTVVLAVALVITAERPRRRRAETAAAASGEPFPDEAGADVR